MVLSKSNPKLLIESFSCSLFWYLQVSEKEVRYRKAIDKGILNRDTNGQNGRKMRHAVHFIQIKRCLYKAKILSVLRQKHQVVHDHYSFESLKTIGSSTVVQLSKACPCGNEGSPMLLIFQSPTSTMSMDKLSNASSTSVKISSALLQITLGLMKPAEQKV